MGSYSETVLGGSWVVISRAMGVGIHNQLG